MKIFYDGLIYELYRQRPGGISNFFDQLISSVSDVCPALLTSVRPVHLPHPSGKYLKIARFDIPIRPSRYREAFRSELFSLRARAFRPDLIHPTYYRNPSKYSHSVKLVYTAFDMIHEKWSSQKDPDGKHAALKYDCFSRASAIPCISKSTQSDLVDLYPHLEDKTSVIYLAGGFHGFKPRDPSLGQDFPNSTKYFLYVGDRRSYKNFTRLLLAFSSLVKSRSALVLNVVGAPFSTEELDLIDALYLNSRVHAYSTVSTEELIDLYRQSTCLVYPSLYEGFGIPVLEAMSLGVPVIASNTSSIPEVAGDAALYVNPYDLDGLRESMLLLLEKPGLSDDLRCKGLRRSQLFTWKKVAEEYMELYARVLANGRSCLLGSS